MTSSDLERLIDILMSAQTDYIADGDRANANRYYIAIDVIKKHVDVHTFYLYDGSIEVKYSFKE